MFGETHPVLIEIHRVEHPDQRIDELLHQPRLADGRRVAGRATIIEREHLPGRRLVGDVALDSAAAGRSPTGGMVLRLGMRPWQRVLDPQQGEDDGQPR